MAIAAYWWGGRREVGILSNKRTELKPLSLGSARETGALALIEYLAAGHPMPKAAGPSLPSICTGNAAMLPVP